MSNCIETKFVDAQYKDSSPIGTVKRIKEILASYAIATEEIWHETNVPYCFALSVKVVGTTFQVNGKGLNSEFALASAYGELMERLQLGYIQSPTAQKNGRDSYCRTRDEWTDAQELLDDHPNWFSKLSDNLRKYAKTEMKPEAIVAQYKNPDGKVLTVPFLSLSSLKTVHYPKSICTAIYTSNGCAAGNTPEEAIVQAISETAERHHMLQTLYFGITPPDIPEETLRKYPTALGIIEYLRAQDFRVTVKDCSLGKKFPVVCVCIVDNQSGKYHTHFGAYPVLEIALERSLTESFQGRNLRNVASFSNILQLKPGESNYNNIANELVYGGHEKTTFFFSGNPQYEYNENMGFSGTNNRELFRECVEYFNEQGYEILVRDCSSLGFPTYQVIIPGYSETYIHRLCPSKNEHRYSGTAARFFRNPSWANSYDILSAMLHLGEMSRFSNIRNSHSFVSSTMLPISLTPQQDNFYLNASLAYGYYSLGKLAQCAQSIGSMIATNVPKQQEYLMCVKRYLELKLGGYSSENIETILLCLHKVETVKQVTKCISSGRNPIKSFTLHCDLVHCEDCQIRDNCCQKRVIELSDLISNKTLEIDPDYCPQVMRQLLCEQ